jgi:outer membrane murein-binding lipoprotein Lpp
VFLALAVGVVLGSVLLSGTVLSGLRAENQELHSQIDALADQKNALDEKLGTANDFNTRMAGRIVRGELTDKSVVIFRTPDAHNDDVDAVSQLVGQAGGSVTGTVSLTQQFVDDNSAEKLRSVVDSSIVPAGAQLNTKLLDQGSQAGDLLGIALLIHSDAPAPAVPAVDDGQRDTVLAALRDTGFLTYGDQRIGAANAAVVITGGALGADAGNRGASVARFAAALAPHGSGTVLAGRDGCASGTAAVAVARADAGMAGAISTIDDVDTEAGRITVIMAAAEEIKGGHTGQYGTGHVAGAVIVAN